MKLADFLGTVGLEALATPLWGAQVRSVAALARHSIAELEESLRRPKASGGMGAKFTLSSVQRRGLRELGLPNELAAEVFPDAPEGDSDTEGLTEEAATQKLAALAGPLLMLPTAPKSKVGNALTKGGSDRHSMGQSSQLRWPEAVLQWPQCSLRGWTSLVSARLSSTWPTT